MIVQCTDTLGGRWCTLCGKCTCVTIGERGQRVWAAVPERACPLHGYRSRHGRRFVKRSPIESDLIEGWDY